jgi:endoglucanase
MKKNHPAKYSLIPKTRLQHLTTLIVVTAVAVIGTLLLVSSHADAPSNSGQSTSNNVLGVHISNGQIVNSSGQSVRLLGVAASGTEDACIQDKGFSWGALNAAEAQAMASWHANVVRVPLNEDCWLGINGAPAAYSGTAYQTAIKNWVSTLNNAGMIVILDLHWAAPGTYPAAQQWPMADEDHAPTFWSQVATDFKSNPAVIFDPFNEPYMGTENPTSANWNCWLNGCSTTFSGTINGVANSSVTYTTAGMQQLVTTIRDTGANQPIMVGGLNWAGDPCGLRNTGGNGGVCTEIANMPTDPDKQLAISFHTYSWTACTTTTCWNTVAQAAKTAGLPIITGEIGEDDCTDNYINSYMNWADQNDVSYLAWSWEINYYSSCTPGQATAGPNLQLISNWNGTPSTISGEAVDYRTHLLATASPIITAISSTAGSAPTSNAPAAATKSAGTTTPASQKASGESNADTITSSISASQNNETVPQSSGTALSVSSDKIVKVAYYLDGKLQATKTSAPFGYMPNTTNMLNGTYDFVTTTYYASGKTTTTSKKLNVNNHFSLKQVRLAAQHYAGLDIAIIMLIVIIAFLTFDRQHIVNFVRTKLLKKSASIVNANTIVRTGIPEQPPVVSPGSSATPTVVSNNNIHGGGITSYTVPPQVPGTVYRPEIRDDSVSNDNNKNDPEEKQ